MQPQSSHAAVNNVVKDGKGWEGAESIAFYMAPMWRNMSPYVKSGQLQARIHTHTHTLHTLPVERRCMCVYARLSVCVEVRGTHSRRGFQQLETL